jgi:sugar phosphate isomerase/epimerase
MIFVSTTYYKKKLSDLDDVISELSDLDIDGIEIGSTHKFNTKNNFKKIIKKIKSKKIFIHNFFPPSKDERFVINIASEDYKIREESIKLVKQNIDFCKEINASLYTIHPGFLSLPIPKINYKLKNYDFDFSKKNIIKKNKAFNLMKISLKEIINYAVTKKIKIAIETEGSIQKKNFLLMQTPNEYKKLFDEIPNNLYINFNIAHTYFASQCYKFSIKNFLDSINLKVAAVEISCNNGIYDQHLPLSINSKNLNFLKLIKNKPIILEFRNSTLNQIKESIKIIKNSYENKTI